MNNFSIIYKILKLLEKFMDVEEFDADLISAKSLDISEIRWRRIINIMVNRGYIDGVIVVNYDNAAVPIIHVQNPTITLSGLEYLEGNSFMKKAANLTKGKR